MSSRRFSADLHISAGIRRNAPKELLICEVTEAEGYAEERPGSLVQ